MIALMLIPILASAALWLTAPRLAARCTPACASRALVALSLVVALATGLVLCVVAGIGVVQLSWAGRAGHWSADAVADRFPVSGVVTAIAAVLAITLLAAAIAHMTRAVFSLAAAARSCRALGPGTGGLVVVDDDRVAAYAVPALRGRTVVSRRLLRELDADERRAVLAHESAHLRHRHVVYIQLVELAAAANPCLRPSAVAVRRAVESWADDVAATVVGDRVCVARALAKVSLAYRSSGTRTVPRAALGVASTSDVADRVRHLLDPAQRRSARWVVLMAAVALGCAVSAVSVGVYAHGLFEAAEALFVR